VHFICKRLLWTVFFLIIPLFAYGSEADLSKALKARAGLGATDLSDIVWDGEKIWVAGSGTLSKMLWGDGLRATDWISYMNESGFGRYISYEELIADLEKVTVDDVVAVARDSFQSNALTLATLGPIRERDLDLDCLQF